MLQMQQEQGKKEKEAIGLLPLAQKCNSKETMLLVQITKVRLEKSKRERANS